MKNTCIFIDDTGSPGNKSKSAYISESTVTWAAVILNYDQVNQIEGKIVELSKIINRESSISEFHFKDIYCGKGEFENVDIKVRILIIKLFVSLYNKYSPMVLVQSINKNTLTNSGFRDNFKKTKIDGFNFNKPKDFGLFCLLLGCQKYIKANTKEYQLPVDIFIDEGRQKANTSQNVKSISDITPNGQVKYCSSKDVMLLQFVDFIAFTLNRIQNNFAKENMKKFDQIFMHIVGQIKWNTDIPCIKVLDSDISKLEAEFYNKNLARISQSICKPDKEFIKNMEAKVEFMKFLHQIIDKARYKRKK